jgi:hypothetical protein
VQEELKVKIVLPYLVGIDDENKANIRAGSIYQFY